jgi:hypothetical protein
MTTTKIIISAGFHNVKPMHIRATTSGKSISLSIPQMRRITAHMCPVKGCICGMRHGWVIDGATRNELSEALQEAQIAEDSAAYRKA